jgi:Domain of unknown function (DUF6321)
VSEKSYTKPELRERIKARVMAGSDGGKPGQWSARKAQLVAQEYEAAGGGYKGGKTEAQKSLSKWTDQKWTTSDGKPAERKGGTTRYLPEKAWDKLSPGERAATNAKKREGSRKGEQFVANTEAAAEARKEAMDKFASEGGAWQRSEGKNPEGGLNAKGRASLRAQGHDIKPGVKGPADTPEKQRRKGSFLSRMFGPGAPGSMKQENGEPSRRALSAKAWGEPVPQDDAGRARLYAKGQALLNKYKNKKEAGQNELADVRRAELLKQAEVYVLAHFGLNKFAYLAEIIGSPALETAGKFIAGKNVKEMLPRFNALGHSIGGSLIGAGTLGMVNAATAGRDENALGAFGRGALAGGLAGAGIGGIRGYMGGRDLAATLKKDTNAMHTAKRVRDVLLGKQPISPTIYTTADFERARGI